MFNFSLLLNSIKMLFYRPVFVLFLWAQTGLLQGQEISLTFPKFAGSSWDLILLRGLEKDTIRSGVIPPDGKVILTIPETHRDYCGMARWMLRNGGGLDFVLNRENFSVECLSDQPNESNIIYTGSVENTFLRENHHAQELILARYEAVHMALSVYPPGSVLHDPLVQEEKRLLEEYTVFQKNLMETNLYAARFREIVNFTRGSSKSLGLDEYGRALEADDFIRHRMSWPALYTSNHWSGVIFSWAQMHAMVIKSDSTLMESTRHILGKLDDKQLYTAFCEQLARYFIKFGKDSLLFELSSEVRNSRKLLRHDGLLAQFESVYGGEIAPVLILPDGSQMDWTTAGAKSLLVFYQSDCGSCESTLEQLKSVYHRLKSAGIRVVTISADKDASEFKRVASAFPWPETYCDLKGFEGSNFKSYGVAGTPTLFTIDKNGRIMSRLSDLKTALLWLERED